MSELASESASRSVLIGNVGERIATVASAVVERDLR